MSMFVVSLRCQNVVMRLKLYGAIASFLLLVQVVWTPDVGAIVAVAVSCE